MALTYDHSEVKDFDCTSWGFYDPKYGLRRFPTKESAKRAYNEAGKEAEELDRYLHPVTEAILFRMAEHWGR